MKIIKFTTLIILLFSLTSMNAFSGETDPKKGKAVAELTSLLGKPGITAGDHDRTALIYFMLNRQHEIVVIQVEANDAQLEGYIKGRLNYREIKSKELLPGKEYMVPVRIKSSI